MAENNYPQSTYQIVGNYVKSYNEAIKAGNIEQAIASGTQAVKLATAELRSTSLLDAHKTYYESVLNIIQPFLKNPQAAVKKSSGSAAQGNPSEDKIKSTDWFASPIPNLRLKDIAGLENVKNEFIVNVFAPTDPKYADKYKKYRGEERGLQILLYGPPGTGKTHVVKCLAGEMGCKIAVVQIKDVMANLVGDGAKIISEIFEQAKQYDRSIIFFDEIDAIASSREDDDSRHTKEQLTTLLTNMDGFTSKAKPGQIRIVIAATNRPWALDSAVKRGGRFDTQIYVPLPDEQAREQLIRLALGKDPNVKNRVDIPLAKDVTIPWLVERTRGYAGADIKSICRQAIAYPLKREIFARRSGNESNDCITVADFEAVFAKYINSITDESLTDFDAYRMNMEYSKEYVEAKCDMLVRALYSNYLRETTGDKAKYAYTEIEAFELKLFMNAYSSGRIKERFKGKDLSFLAAYLPKLCERLKVPFVPQSGNYSDEGVEPSHQPDPITVLAEELKGIKEMLAKILETK